MRVRAAAPMAISLLLTGLLCVLLTPQIETLASQLPAYFGRAVGFGLLGLAVIAIVAVFRSLPVIPPAPRLRPSLPRDSEFRRGFAKTRNGSIYRPRLEPKLVRRSEFGGSGEIVPLRRPSPEPEASTTTAPRKTSHENIEIVKKRLEDRAEALWRRRAG